MKNALSPAKGIQLREEKKRFFRETVLEWGEKKRRRFPWRKTKDPYKILVSEILLQKTTASQVQSVYSTFFERFPSVKDLAEADVKEIEEAIKELGLLKRARFLKQSAKTILETFKGEIPKDKESLKSLKGVGDYTSNAVLLFAFGRPRPIIDSNVARVLTRFFGLVNIENPTQSKDVWSLSGSLLPKNQSKEFSYALLDLGAVVCSSPKPSCENCPLADSCSYLRC